MSMFLTEDQIRAARGKLFSTFHVPELGGDLRLRALSAKASVEFQKLQKKVGSEEVAQLAALAFLVENAVVDDDGKPFFKTKEAVDEFLDVIPFGSALELMNACLELTKPSKATKEPAPGNSVASQSAS